MKRRELLIHPTMWVGLKNSVLSSRNQTQEYILCNCLYKKSFPGGSDGKESACNAEDLGLSPGSGRSPGEGNGFPLQCSFLENAMDRGAWWATVLGVTKRLDWVTNTFTSCYLDNGGSEIWNKKQEEEFIEENLLNFRYHEFKMLGHPQGKTANNFPGQLNPFPWFQLLSVCCCCCCC